MPTFNHLGLHLEDDPNHRIAGVVVPRIVEHPPGTNKDYPLWFETGLKVRFGFEVYPQGKVFPFMYPPFAGWVLALLSYLGREGMFFALIGINVICLGLAVELAVRLVAGTTQVSWWLRILPSACCFFFIHDMFFLGQPNLGLLMLMLSGFLLLQKRYLVLAGIPFAIAAALKAFPVVVIVYLLWRKQWRASISMILSTVVLLVMVPATIRGWDQNIHDLKIWADGMIFRQGADGIGQRPEQSLSWQNQSLFGVGHRLLRHIDADIVNEEAHEPLYVNVLNLDYRSASLAILGVAGLLGLAFVAVMPRSNQRTRNSDSAEFSMLLILITIGTPYAYLYYAVWMLFPFTALVYRALTDSERIVRRACWLTIIVAMLWYASGVPFYGDHTMQAIGSMFWAELSMLLTFSWLLLRERWIR